MPSHTLTGTDRSLFLSVTKKAGLQLKNGKADNEISVDKAVFQRQITHELRSCPGDINEVLEEFMDGFSGYIKDMHRFHKSLLPTVSAAEHASAGTRVQDSAVRILLGVDSLQPLLVRTLLEKLPEFSQSDETTLMDVDKANIPRLILAQFRWLDFVTDSKMLTDLLLELLEATDVLVQKEIINALPAIIDDASHSSVASTLRTLLVSKTQLTVDILNALACLDLNEKLLEQVRTSAIQALKSVDAENLPVVLKFLLRTASFADLMGVVGEVRAGLDLASLLAVTGRMKNSAAMSGASNEKQKGIAALILDTVQSGIHYQRGFADAWLKTLDGLEENLKLLDFLVLLILHQTNHRRSVETLIRNKIRSGALSEAVLQSAFSDNSEILQGSLKAVLSLAEVLLRSPEVALSYTGHVVYKLAFSSFDSFCQQEIVARLIKQLGSGNRDEMDASLDVLAALVEQHTVAMTPFAVFFKRLLDFQLQNLSYISLRKLFGMLSRLAFTVDQDPMHIQDDLHMVIRKLTSSLDNKYLCRGIVGGVMMVWGLGACREPSCELDEARQEKAVSLLNMLNEGSSRQPAAAALFLDELAAMVLQGNLHPKMEDWISEIMTDTFQESFVVDIEDEKPSVAGLDVTAQYGLNDREESNIVINLVPLVAADVNKARTSASALHSPGTVYSVCLSPHFHLVQICEQRQHSGNMEAIDALLGCPVYMPADSVYSKLESLSDGEKEVVCSSLFQCINWFIEVVNAFASQTDIEMKGKVIERLHNITHLKDMLSKSLSAYPEFIPPVLGVCSEDGSGRHATGAVASKGKAQLGEKQKGRKRKRPGQEKESREDDHSQNITTQEEKDTQMDSGPNDVNETDKNKLSAYAHCFRELEFGVFTILHTGPIVQASLDSDLHTKHTRDVYIQAAQLQFLLEDLVQKLTCSLIPASSKRHFRPKMRIRGKRQLSSLNHRSPAQVAACCVQLLPALCSHLESASAFFQTLVADSDSIVDGPGSGSLEVVRMATCLHLLLQALLALFSWNGFVLPSNDELLKEALSMLVGRVCTTGATQQSLADQLRFAFQYLEKFMTTAPTLSVATTLVRLLTVLACISEEAALKQRLADISRNVLEREWKDTSGQTEKGAACNEQLQVLVRTWVRHSTTRTQSMQAIIDSGMRQLLQRDQQTSATTLAMLSRSSFPVFLRVVLMELVELAKCFESLTPTDSHQVREERLLGWSVAVRILFSAVSVVKELNSHASVAACLKSGRQFIEVFLQRGMPVLDATFTSHSADVHALLRTLQQSTRTLQHMCGHVKRTQDVNQVNQVPPLKCALERLVLRVKHMLTLNNCQRAFWIGNLKNKTLKGEEILSQAADDTDVQSNTSEQQPTSMQEEEDSEVEPVDGENVAETTEVTSDNSEEGSYSHMY